MKTLLRGLADESVLVGALVSAVCVALDLPETWMNVVLAAVPLLLALLVRSVTTSPSSLTKTVADVVQTLDGPAAGAVGTVTKKGEGVIDSVVGAVGGLAGRLAPKAEEVTA